MTEAGAEDSRRQWANATADSCRRLVESDDGLRQRWDGCPEVEGAWRAMTWCREVVPKAVEPRRVVDKHEDAVRTEYLDSHMQPPVAAAAAQPIGRIRLILRQTGGFDCRQHMAVVLTIHRLTRTDISAAPGHHLHVPSHARPPACLRRVVCNGGGWAMVVHEARLSGRDGEKAALPASSCHVTIMVFLRPHTLQLMALAVKASRTYEKARLC
ncbi:hypothetical protein IWZ00DRAFT_50043 [Phyllosticta capitalensis]